MKTKILATRQVAEMVGVKPYKIYQLIKQDNMPFIKLVRSYCFFEKSILLWKAIYDKRQAKKADTLSTKEIASMLSISIANVYTLAKNEGLPCIIEKRGNVNRYYFKEEAVVGWLLSKEQSKPAEEEIAELLSTNEKAQEVAMPSGIAA